MLATLLALASLGVEAGKPPLILVPGLTGSSLEVKLSGASMPHYECISDTHGKWMDVWLDPSLLLPREVDCLIARLTITYDAASDSYSNLPGVELRAHSRMDFLYKYEFGSMITSLQSSLNYTLGADLHLAPYDWRLAGDSHSREQNGVGGFYTQLKTLIEQSVQSSGHKAVVLSHSLGCPTILYFFHNFVSEEWRASHIQGWIAVSGPWLGSTMLQSAYLGGYTMGLPGWLFPHDFFKRIQVNSSSGVWMSPDPMAFGDTPVVTTPSKSYTAGDLTDLISLIGQQAGGDQVIQLRKKLSGDLPSLQKPPANIPVQNWYSVGVATSERYDYDREVTAGFNIAPSTIHYGEGDGTVNHASLLAVERLWPNVASAPVTTRVFEGPSHFSILSDKRLLQALTDYLTSQKSLIGHEAVTDVIV